MFLYRGTFKPWVLTKENLERSTPKKEDPIKIQDFGSTGMASFSRTPLKKWETEAKKIEHSYCQMVGMVKPFFFESNFYPYLDMVNKCEQHLTFGAHVSLNWVENQLTSLGFERCLSLCAVFSPKAPFHHHFFWIVFCWRVEFLLEPLQKPSLKHLLKQKKSRILYPTTKQKISGESDMFPRELGDTSS